MNFTTIEQALEDLKEGKFVVVVDDEDRENEGDLIMAAEFVTPESINFMISNARGIVCVPMTSERLYQLGISQMVPEELNRESNRCKFTVSVDSVKGTSTGVSALDRAVTIRTLINPTTKPTDFARPGHVFPLRAEKAGVLKRVGHTEATIDLARLAGLYPAGGLCEILNEDGTMARQDDLFLFAQKHQLKIIKIADLVKYRLKQEKIIERTHTVKLPTKYGLFNLYAYTQKINNEHHIALVYGDISGKQDVLVRMHSECLTGDVFGSQRCDCGEQLDISLKKIVERGSGVLVYLCQEGRGIGFMNKMHAYALQEQGLDTVDANIKLGFKADLRDYGTGAQILGDLGLSTIHLLTNNPKKIVGLEGYGLKITQRIPLTVVPNENNKDYLQTKKNKMGHLI